MLPDGGAAIDSQSPLLTPTSYWPCIEMAGKRRGSYQGGIDIQGWTISRSSGRRESCTWGGEDPAILHYLWMGSMACCQGDKGSRVSSMF